MDGRTFVRMGRPRHGGWQSEQPVLGNERVGPALMVGSSTTAASALPPPQDRAESPAQPAISPAKHPGSAMLQSSNQPTRGWFTSTIIACRLHTEFTATVVPLTSARFRPPGQISGLHALPLPTVTPCGEPVLFGDWPEHVSLNRTGNSLWEHTHKRTGAGACRGGIPAHGVTLTSWYR
jgi:hypothetical protein